MRGVAIGPHARPVVEVEDDLGTALAQVEPVLAGVRCRPLGEGPEGDPQDRALADHLDGHVGGRHLRVRGRGPAVEDDLGILGGIEGGEHHRGLPIGRPDVRRVDTPRGELRADVVTQGALAHLRHDGGPTAEARRGHGDIGGGAAHGLGEGLRLEEARTLLLRVEVDAHASDGDDLRDHDDATRGATTSRR